MHVHTHTPSLVSPQVCLPGSNVSSPRGVQPAVKPVKLVMSKCVRQRDREIDTHNRGVQPAVKPVKLVISERERERETHTHITEASNLQ